MLAIFCTYLVCAEINQSQSRSPDLNQVLIACALERVLTIIDHRAVEIFELGLALQPTANQLVKFASYERCPVAQSGTGSGAGFL